jgi:Tetratricopeptide repeat
MHIKKNMVTKSTFRIALVSAALSAASLTALASDSGAFGQAPTEQQAQAYVSSGNFAEAISAYRAIIKEQPNNATAHFMLGYALHASGDIDNAILAHKKATKMPEVAGLAHYNLGCAYAIKGQTDDAFDALNSSIAMGVRDTAQFKNDGDLKSLRKDERWKPMIESIKLISEAEKAMHFWVGDWDCYSSSNGTLSGKNTLSFRVGKNVIHESWESDGQQYSGESWNVYDRSSNSWKQTWSDSMGNVIYLEAPLSTESSEEYEGLMFEGTNVSPGKETSMLRMHVRPVDDGRVMQTGFSSKDKGKTWKQEYELLYVPSGEPYSPIEADG